MKEVPMPTVVDEKWAMNDVQRTAAVATDLEQVPLPKDNLTSFERKLLSGSSETHPQHKG